MINELRMILRYLEWRKIGQMVGAALLGAALAVLLCLALWTMYDLGLPM